jgi:hypothetical protein
MAGSSYFSAGPMKILEYIKNREWPSWMLGLLVFLGAFLYLIQAVIYAHTTIPGLDEGSYLLKGILYLRKVYEPFEPYGPLTNKAPFAFLIPGFAEYLLGAGLRTGRYFAIFLGLMTLLGMWITARRWAGKWVAVLTVWVFVLSPKIIKVSTVAASEVIIACMLTWICVFVLAENRSIWQIVLGAILAASVVLTRQNMAPVLPLLILYVFWQHGKEKGIWSFAVGSAVFLAVHIYYWPNILTIWAPWLPDGITPFLDLFRLPKDAIPVWNPSVDFWNRLLSFFQGIRHHFVPVVGSVFSLFLWTRPSRWKSTSAFRAAVFLALIYFILFFLHAWAAVASQYESYSCVYCFTAYLTFFDPLGVLLTVIVLSSSGRFEAKHFFWSLLILVVLVLAAGIGYSLFETVGPQILNFEVPRMRDGKLLPGTTLLVDFVKNKFVLSFPAAKRVISTMLGAAFALIVMLVSLLFRDGKKSARYLYSLLNVFLVLGVMLSPLFNYDGGSIDCKQDLIFANEQLGHYLDEVIPANSLVYWEGGLSFAPLIYAPNVRIFPPQINDGYTFRKGGDPDLVYRLSHWNAAINDQWINSADIFIVEASRFPKWSKFLSPEKFEEYPSSPYAPSCQDGAELRIFHRLP